MTRLWRLGTGLDVSIEDRPARRACATRDWTAGGGGLRRTARFTFLGAILALAVAGCGSAAGTPVPGATPASTVASTPVATPSPTATATPVPTPPPTFSTVGAMSAARAGGAATLLDNGRILVTGGCSGAAGGPAIASAELYDPHSRAFIPIHAMNSARAGHTATVLNNGRVLIVGGTNGPKDYPHLAELFDPQTNTFQQGIPGYTARAGHTATLLNDGRVLVAGGAGLSGVLASAFLYDPKTNTIAVVPGSKSGLAALNSMTVARTGHTATLLSDGRVLLVGGTDGSATLATAEVYDPATNKFTATGSMAETRSGHTATMLSDKLVLIAGGATGSASHDSAELYDPSTGKFAATGTMTDARSGHAATLLPNGQVLITGGVNGLGTLPSAELYDPATGKFAPTVSMGTPRAGQAAIAVLPSQVLIVGGRNGSAALASAEVYAS